jgi:hypothetical protein
MTLNIKKIADIVIVQCCAAQHCTADVRNMVSLPRYVCTKCGRGFASARSGRRHVKNVEGGYGYIVTEASYRTALTTGMIPPPIPIFQRPKPKKDLNWSDIALEEMHRGYWRRMGEKMADQQFTSASQQFTSASQQFTSAVMDVSKIFQTLTPPSPSSPAQPTTTTPIQGGAAAASSQDRLKDFLLDTSYLQNMDKEERINFLRKIGESSIGQVKREKSS